MKLQPIIKQKTSVELVPCAKCGLPLPQSEFLKVKSAFYPDGYIPICNHCLQSFVQSSLTEWETADKACQWMDIPFIPAEFENCKKQNPSMYFIAYARMMLGSEYEAIEWKTYNQTYKDLQKKGELDRELPLISDARRHNLQMKWGPNYDDEALEYLEHLYNGLLATQNVNGDLQGDQVLKLCKISYEIDRKIAAGEEFDKLLGSYDKLVKIGEFTPKNVKNINDFDSTGELIKWLEKRGWKNPFYDRVTRDVVDETMKNIEAFNQRLYTNENGIADEISRRIEQLKSASQMEHQYDTDTSFDLEAYDNAGYEELRDLDNDEFDPGIGDDNG